MLLRFNLRYGRNLRGLVHNNKNFIVVKVIIQILFETIYRQTFCRFLATTLDIPFTQPTVYL